MTRCHGHAMSLSHTRVHTAAHARQESLHIDFDIYVFTFFYIQHLSVSLLQEQKRSTSYDTCRLCRPLASVRRREQADQQLHHGFGNAPASTYVAGESGVSDACTQHTPAHTHLVRCRASTSPLSYSVKVAEGGFTRAESRRHENERTDAEEAQRPATATEDAPTRYQRFYRFERP